MVDAAAGRLLILGGGTWLYDRASALGIELFIIHDRARATDALSGDAGRVLLVDDLGTDDMLEALAASLHVVWPFSSCLSLTERGLLPAARINTALGLWGVSTGAVERTRDKYLMRQILHHAGLSTLPFAAVETAEDLVAFADRQGFPLILKPRCGTGSRGITLVHDAHAISCLRWPMAEPMMVEVFVPGAEYSVETFSYAGEHRVVAITAKRIARDAGREGFVEIGHALPAPLEVAENQAIGHCVRSWLDALGIAEGPCHTEFKIDGGEIQIIETHTRVGGDNIPDLVQLATGFDLYRTSLEWFAWRTPPETMDSASFGAAIRYLMSPAGKVKEVRGLETARLSPGVRSLQLQVRKNDSIPELASSGNRIGYVVAVGDDAIRADHACQVACELVDIRLVATE